MCLHGATGHFELAGNLCVITALKQQLRNLLLTETESDRPIFHVGFSPSFMISVRQQNGFTRPKTRLGGTPLWAFPAAEDSKI